jgi:hypothetical protein
VRAFHLWRFPSNVDQTPGFSCDWLEKKNGMCRNVFSSRDPAREEMLHALPLNLRSPPACSVDASRFFIDHCIGAVANLGACSMRTGPAITLRTCSTCTSWSGDGKVHKGEHVIKASCLSHKEIKSGSDKCGRWEKRRIAEVKSIFFWGVVSHK